MDGVQVDHHLDCVKRVLLAGFDVHDDDVFFIVARDEVVFAG